MVGRPMTGVLPERAAASGGGGEVLLAVQDVAAPPTVRHASFELRRGEILGLAGLAGSGRTELGRALFGLEPGSSGRITLRDRTLAVQGANPAQRLAQGFGDLSEDRTREGPALPLSLAGNLTGARPAALARR